MPAETDEDTDIAPQKLITNIPRPPNSSEPCSVVGYKVTKTGWKVGWCLDIGGHVGFKLHPQ